MNPKMRLTKLACYAGCVSQAAVICMSPILFVTFHQTYGISYTLLGLLTVFNFCAQLAIDLIFTAFSAKFNLARTLRITPLITICGILIYALMPIADPAHPYLWIAVGTVIYSVAAGLCEVLLSPTIAAMPSENPEREMSRFHSSYAWGVVAMVAFSTLFLYVFGTDRWPILSLLMAVCPLCSAIFFFLGEIPALNADLTSEQSADKKKMIGAAMCFVLCIFLGSAAENTMTQWCSGYVETVFRFSKLLGDLLGLSLFAIMLGTARSLYGRFGKRIDLVMIWSFAGAIVAYLIAGLVPVPEIGLAACAVCGLFVAMLWPGTLIWAEQSFGNCGVAVYALFAAGGDFGASVAPQLMGIVTDTVAESPAFAPLAASLSISPEQLGLKAAMILSAVFPALGLLVALRIRRRFPMKRKAPDASA